MTNAFLYPVFLIAGAALCQTDTRSQLETESGLFRPAVCPVAIPDGSDLGDRLDFGYVTVPEQRANPQGRSIQLAVARFRSDSEDRQPEPLILNNGGPGDSNLDLFVPLMAGPLGQALLAQRDVVIIELRGLRHSKPNLVCHEVFEAQLNMMDKNLSAQEANRVLLTAMRESHDRFVDEGINLSAYNNVEAAADIDRVMTVLSYDRFNMLGASGGTLVAQHVMRDYPKRVRSVVLNAAVPRNSRFFPDMLRNASETLERVFGMCEADSEAKAVYPDLENRFFALLDQLNEEPVTILVRNPATQEESPLVLNGDRLSTWLFVSMYYNTQVPRSLHRIMSGDYSEIQNHARVFFPMETFSYGLSYCIFSTEFLNFDVDATKVDGRYARFADGVSLFFSPRLIAQAREFWKVTPLEQAHLKPLKSNIPTLILNGELDHVLPERYIAEMTSRLEHGYAYRFPGVAHSPIDAGECPLSMVLDFLADPSQPPDSGCMEGLKHVFALDP